MNHRCFFWRLFSFLGITTCAPNAAARSDISLLPEGVTVTADQIAEGAITARLMTLDTIFVAENSITTDKLRGGPVTLSRSSLADINRGVS